MAYDRYGNYEEAGFFESVFSGVVILVLLAAVLSIPGWISAAFWGWDRFWAGAGIFWLGVAGLTILVTFLWVLGSDD